MNLESVDTLFTESMRNFLEKQGFSHIFSIGIYPNEMEDRCDTRTGKPIYWLEPVKPDDPRLDYAEDGHILSHINDLEIIDMAAFETNVRFMIQVPADEYSCYISKTKANQRITVSV